MKKLFVLLFTVAFFVSCGSSSSEACDCVKEANQLKEQGWTQLMYIQSTEGKKCMEIVKAAKEEDDFDPKECE